MASSLDAKGLHENHTNFEHILVVCFVRRVQPPQHPRVQCPAGQDVRASLRHAELFGALVGLGIVEQDELVGVTKTLDAAAYTYVAAFVSSLGWLLYFLAARR